jgi:hypothetical protein
MQVSRSAGCQACFACRTLPGFFLRTGGGFASSAGLAACATYVLRNISYYISSLGAPFLECLSWERGHLCPRCVFEKYQAGARRFAGKDAHAHVPRTRRIKSHRHCARKNVRRMKQYFWRKSVIFTYLSHKCPAVVTFAGHSCPHMNSIDKCLAKNHSHDGRSEKIITNKQNP